MHAKDYQLAGATRYRAGDLPGAIAALTEAARLDPAEPAYLLNLAELARVSGAPAEARRWLEGAEALTRHAPTVERLNLLSAGWLDAGDRPAALNAAGDALRLGDNLPSRQLFAEALRGVAPSPEDRPLVVRALNEAWLRIDQLQGPANRLLLQTWPQTTAELANDPLLAALLACGPIGDEVLERRLTALRAELLTAPDDEALRPLRVGLATQGFINEYAWAVSDGEQAALSALRASDPTPDGLLRLAGYVALGTLPDAVALLERDWPEDLRAVLRQQVQEPAVERALAAAMPAMTPIRAGVSEQVQAQYEENPYPRWTRTPRQQPQPFDRVLRSALPLAPLGPIPNAAAPEILIAGCGTGQHAIDVAQRYAGARVVAIDLSRASLAYARRKADELGLANIVFALADLLEISGPFDVVDAAGSLHHLADPLEGVRVLAAALRPGGLFRFGLYSALGRRPLRAARDLGNSFAPTPDGIRAFRQALLAAPPGHPVREAVSFSSDFYSLSACRDLLLHVQEHQHTIPELDQMMEQAALRFLGFALPPETLRAYRQAHPGDPAATDLAAWAAFEPRHPTAFARMYQFWAQKV